MQLLNVLGIDSWSCDVFVEGVVQQWVWFQYIIDRRCSHAECRWVWLVCCLQIPLDVYVLFFIVYLSSGWLVSDHKPLLYLFLDILDFCRISVQWRARVLRRDRHGSNLSDVISVVWHLIIPKASDLLMPVNLQLLPLLRRLCFCGH